MKQGKPTPHILVDAKLAANYISNSESNYREKRVAEARAQTSRAADPD